MKKQVFMNKFTSTVSRHEVIRMKNDDNLTDRDLTVCEFLLQNKFATLVQINKMLKAKGFVELHPNRAFKLSQYRIINRFALLETEDAKLDGVSEESLIYCLDIGGKYLLTQYSSLDTTEWATSTNMVSESIVQNVLMANDIYLKLLDTLKDRLLVFNIMQERRVGRNSTTIDFEFGLKTGDNIKYYIGNFFREEDYLTNCPKKTERIESLITTNAWKKYYFGAESSPACFFIGENDKFALRIANQVNDCYSLDGKDRYSSFNRLSTKNLYDVDTFLKYEKSEKDSGFKVSKISSFAPEN